MRHKSTLGAPPELRPPVGYQCAVCAEVINPGQDAATFWEYDPSTTGVDTMLMTAVARAVHRLCFSGETGLSQLGSGLAN